MTTDISAEQETLFKQVARERNRCGPALFQTALAAVREINPAIPLGQAGRLVIEQIDERIRPFSGDSRMMTDVQWASVYAKAEEAARRELLAGSGDQKEADKLTRQAKESQRLADQAEAGLRRDWNEFLTVPEEASRLKAVLDQIGHEREMLDQETLKSGYQQLYQHSLKTGQDTRQAELATIPLFVFADWRRETLTKLEAETNAKLSTLKKRNLELAKKLGRPPHDLG